MNCLICNQKLIEIFKKKILKKYEIKYYHCLKCDFVQTEKPFWLAESYKKVISDLDVGVLKRNGEFSEFVEYLILNYLDEQKKYLDYGGGYGIFTRMLRDKGFDYYRYDPLCKNLFALGFDAPYKKNNYELLTAFEVFEHLAKPCFELKKMFYLSKNILFSTELRPNSVNLKKWWYLLPETGQHISFYSLKTLNYIATKNKVYLYTNGFNLHLFSVKKLNNDPFKKFMQTKRFGFYLNNLKNLLTNSKANTKTSLLAYDFQIIKKLHKL